MDNIQLLVFDIDGTLVDRSKQTVELSAIESINQARNKGYHILIATGRSFFFIHDDVRERINSEFYVTVNGACLTDSEGNVLETHEFDTDSLNTLIDFCKVNNYPLGIKYEEHIGVYGDFDFFIKNYTGYNHSKVAYLFDDNKTKSHLNNKALGVYVFAPVLKIDDFKELLPNLNFIPTDFDTIEAVKKDVDKVKTIEEVMRKLNVTWANVAVFGDGHNDVEMIKKAKCGVAMGNASDYVQSKADYVTDNILEDGIKNAMEYLDIL